MEIYAWCIMPSHMHIVFRSTEVEPEELIGGFKSFTSGAMVRLIKAPPAPASVPLVVRMLSNRHACLYINPIRKVLFLKHEPQLQIP